MFKQNIRTKYSKYRFEIKHITIFFIVLIIFQILLAYIQKISLNEFLNETQDWYQKHSAERLAIVTSTSLELLFENVFEQKDMTENQRQKIISSFNVIFKQQLIQKSVEDICLIIMKNHRLYVIDSGRKLYSYFFNSLQANDGQNDEHNEGVNLFLSMKEKMQGSEVIFSTLSDQKTFNILVPFVPNGEYLGVMYMKITPNFAFITDEVSVNFDKVSLIYSALILMGLLAIFFVSSQTVKERNEAQSRLFEEHKELIKNQVRSEKESLFTKRIYHTHHKAEKIIGFIKEDVRQASAENIEDVKERILTYSNFMSRIIYDMKWYDQAINTIINPMFNTNINEVITFLIKYIFLRISSKNEMFEFDLKLDDSIPLVHVNEFVVWEILEPLIQNSIDHGNKKSVLITIQTIYDPSKGITTVIISDNGVGVKKELLETGKNGIKRIFLENNSTKKTDNVNSGYGCYIAYQMAVVRCGWNLDVNNLETGGCQFTITIKH